MFCTTLATEESPSSMENMDRPWWETFEGFAVGKKQFTNCMYKTDNLWINNKIRSVAARSAKQTDNGEA